MPTPCSPVVAPPELKKLMGLNQERPWLAAAARGQSTQEDLLTTLHETTSQASDLQPLTLRGLRDVVLAADPGCLCDPELFTGPADIEPEDEPADERAARIAVAREVCTSCPVRLACLAYTLRTRPAAGVWAGFTPEEVAALVTAANRPARARRNTALRQASAESAWIAQVA
jgi:hypothetical protein